MQSLSFEMHSVLSGRTGIHQGCCALGGILSMNGIFNRLFLPESLLTKKKFRSACKILSGREQPLEMAD